jgi:hypothetical protein
MYRLVSNKGVARRFRASLYLISASLDGSAASSIAMLSNCSVLSTISSASPMPVNMLAAALPANVSAMRVSTGRPTHKASPAVVWAIVGPGVQKQIRELKARQVVRGRWEALSEYEAMRVDTRGGGQLAQVRFGRCIDLSEPKHAAIDRRE